MAKKYGMQGSKLLYFDVFKFIFMGNTISLGFAGNDAVPRQRNNFKASSVRANKDT